VEICCTGAAKVHGLYPRKGTIAPGSDADIVIFDPRKKVRLGTDTLHENCDYTPYESFELEGYPVMVLSRGEVVVREGEFVGREGRGEFVKRAV
jgi:dihydropyrimidinase